jgi:hypothetical protein
LNTTSIIVGDRSAAQSLLPTLTDPENSRIWAAPEVAPDPEAPAVGALARALEELESLLRGQEFDLVLLADDSEQALAAALVATKLLIEVRASEQARNPETANGRVIGQLAAAYTEPA